MPTISVKMADKSRYNLAAINEWLENGFAVVSGNCYEWIPGNPDSNPKVNGKAVKPHRVAVFARTNELVEATCRNKRCVNPAHLEIRTLDGPIPGVIDLSPLQVHQEPQKPVNDAKKPAFNPKDAGLLINPGAKLGFRLPEAIDPSGARYHILDSDKLGEFLRKSWPSPLRQQES